MEVVATYKMKCEKTVFPLVGSDMRTFIQNAFLGDKNLLRENGVIFIIFFPPRFDVTERSLDYAVSHMKR